MRVHDNESLCKTITSMTIWVWNYGIYPDHPSQANHEKAIHHSCLFIIDWFLLHFNYCYYQEFLKLNNIKRLKLSFPLYIDRLQVCLSRHNARPFFITINKRYLGLERNKGYKLRKWRAPWCSNKTRGHLKVVKCQ